MTLDSPDADAAISTYLQADATLRQAKVALTKTQTDLERARKLLQYQAISEKDALAAQNDAATARAALETADATCGERTPRFLLEPPGRDFANRLSSGGLCGATLRSVMRSFGRAASFWAGSSPSLGDVVGDAGLLLRPWVQPPQGRPARRRVTRSRVVHRHIGGTTGQQTRDDDQCQVSRELASSHPDTDTTPDSRHMGSAGADASLRSALHDCFAAWPAALPLAAPRQCRAAGRSAGGVAAASGQFHQPPPRARKSAPVSAKRLAWACTRVITVC